MNEEKYKKERIEYIADKISPYTVAGCDEDLAEAIFNLVEEENARLKDKLIEINDLLNEPIFEYDNIPNGIEEEINELKNILKEN